MHANSSHYVSRLITILLGLLAIVFVITVILHPSEAFTASMNGLQYWWGTLFPALLPYFILCEIALAQRAPGKLSGLLARAVQSWLRIPARLTSSLLSNLLTGQPYVIERACLLHKQGRITLVQAERVLMLTGGAHPILLLTVIGIVLLHHAALGLLLAGVYYTSWLIIACLARYYHRSSTVDPDNLLTIGPAACVDDIPQRSFGSMLGDSVADSLQRLMQLGGLIMILAVLIRMAQEWGLPLDPAINAALAGLLEIHLGAQYIALMQPDSIMSQLIALSAMLAWGGLLQHAHIHSLLRGSQLRYTRYLIARVVQAVLAIALVMVFGQPFLRRIVDSSAGSPPNSQAQSSPAYMTMELWPFAMRYPQIFLLIALIISLLLMRIYSRRQLNR